MKTEIKMERKSAFTIIELLISIMIIGILSTIGYKQYTEAIDKAKAKGVVELFKKADSAIGEFYSTEGRHPFDLILDENMKDIMVNMEFKLNKAGTSFLLDLGPRTKLSISTDEAYYDSGVGSVFKYLVASNVPSGIAAKVIKEINGKNSIGDTPGTLDKVSCNLVDKGYFIGSVSGLTNVSEAVAPTVDGEEGTPAIIEVQPSSGTLSCDSFFSLTDSSGVRNTTLFYTFYRGINALDDAGGW